MQQQMYQQDQQGGQEQVGQQMVLCPVRLVYETQMLVQPGEQIQPNQTILINPQNTPPWIQNRQMQNQVIYVQHVPTNYIPQPQQHIDQNQLYIQNYGYQNVPQMFVQNHQEQIRPLQMMQNMVPNMQTLQAMQTNIGQIQNPRMLTNVAPIQQQVNIVNTANTQNQNNVNINRMITPSQVNTTEVINKAQEVPHNVFRHQMPQTVQEPRFQIQPTITMVPNNNTNMVQSIQRVPQTFDPNVTQIRPVQQNIAPSIQQAYPNTIFNVDDSRKTNTANKGTNVTNYNVVNHVPAAKSIPQNYRPIQPRTAQVRTSAPNLLPMQPAPTIQAQHNMPNIISMNNVPRKVMPNTIPVANVNTQANIKVEGNNFQFNRKRKSESPDEVHKKVINNQSEAPIIKQTQNETFNVNMNSSADVGVNTSPIHRPSGRITINNMQITPLNPNIPNSRLIEELAKPVRSNTNAQVLEAQNVTRNISAVPDNAAETVTNEKEKLVRNTVFVQARGRILTDKDNVPEVPKIEPPISNPASNTTLQAVKPKIETVVSNTESSITLPNLKPKIEPIVHKEVNLPKLPAANNAAVKVNLPAKTETVTMTKQIKPIISQPALNEKQIITIPKPSISQPVLNEKQIVTIPKPSISQPVLNENQIVTNQESITEKNEIKKESNAVKALTNEDNKRKTISEKTRIDEIKKIKPNTVKTTIDEDVKSKKNTIKTPVKVEESKSKVKLEIKQETSSRTLTEPPKELPKEDVTVKTETKPDVKVKEEIPDAKEDKGYILTHVLGGFVIQESNIAFPIRKPLKERTLFNNTEESKKENKDVKREREFMRDNSKILDISHLNIKECEEAESDDNKAIEDKENPFKNLKASEVKTWTAQQLAEHLSQYSWNETVAALQEHELDGESLLLVSRAQLISIGVEQHHADLICEFLKS